METHLTSWTRLLASQLKTVSMETWTYLAVSSSSMWGSSTGLSHSSFRVAMALLRRSFSSSLTGGSTWAEVSVSSVVGVTSGATDDVTLTVLPNPEVEAPVDGGWRDPLAWPSSTMQIKSIIIWSWSRILLTGFVQNVKITIPWLSLLITLRCKGMIIKLW